MLSNLFSTRTADRRDNARQQDDHKIMNDDPAARDMPYYDFLARYALQNTQHMARDFDPGNSCGRKPVATSDAASAHSQVSALSEVPPSVSGRLRIIPE